MVPKFPEIIFSLWSSIGFCVVAHLGSPFPMSQTISQKRDVLPELGWLQTDGRYTWNNMERWNWPPLSMVPIFTLSLVPFHPFDESLAIPSREDIEWDGEGLKYEQNEWIRAASATWDYVSFKVEENNFQGKEREWTYIMTRIKIRWIWRRDENRWDFVVEED